MSKTKQIVLGIVIVLLTAAALCAVFFLYLMPRVIRPSILYEQADAFYSAGRYEQAGEAFAALGGYKDSRDRVKGCETAVLDRAYGEAEALFAAGRYEEAQSAFAALGGHRDSAERAEACWTAILDRAYDAAMTLFTAGDFEAADAAFQALGDYKDSAVQVLECRYASAAELYETGQYEAAGAAFRTLGDYKDSVQMAGYTAAAALFDGRKYAEAGEAFAALGDFRDSAEKVTACCQGSLTLAEEDLRSGNAAGAIKTLQALDPSRLSLEQQLQRQKLYQGCGRLLESKGEYADAFKLYEQTDATYFEKDMERCNEKYRTEPHRMPEQCAEVDGITWKYKGKQIVVTVRYSVKRTSSLSFETWYNDGSIKKRSGTLYPSRTSYTLTIPYAEVSKADRIRYFKLFIGMPNKAYEDIYLNDFFVGADRDLYGNPLN